MKLLGFEPRILQYLGVHRGGEGTSLKGRCLHATSPMSCPGTGLFGTAIEEPRHSPLVDSFMRVRRDQSVYKEVQKK